MRPIVPVIFALILPQIALGEEAAPAPVTISAAETSLEAYLWTHRPLVVFADAEADPRFAEQMALLAADSAALFERDVIIVTDTDPAARSSVRRRPELPVR